MAPTCLSARDSSKRRRRHRRRISPSGLGGLVWVIVTGRGLTTTDFRGGMKSRNLSLISLVCWVVLSIGSGSAQSSSAPPAAPPGASTTAAQLQQVAYIKASNPHANDHFGNGGTL